MAYTILNALRRMHFLNGFLTSRNKKIFWLLALAAIPLLLHDTARADSEKTETPNKPFLIGQITEAWGRTHATAGLIAGLQEIGYRENEDFVIGVRFTQGDSAILPAAAQELVLMGVDLIFTGGLNLVKTVMSVTSEIPIVFAGASGDPVELRMIQSFSRPGGNVTGVTDLDFELSPKRLEIFKAMVPGLQRVLFPYDPDVPFALAAAEAYREGARRLGIELLETPVRTREEAMAVFDELQKGNVDGLLATSMVSLNIPGLILETASMKGIPTMFGQSFWVEQGALVSYGPDYYSSGYQAARLVDKIIRGGDPGTIPVEVNPNIEFVINMKTAQSLGLEIAPDMLYQADHLVR